MKKSIKILLLLVFTFNISTSFSLYAQDDREKPIKIIIKRPPPHRLNQADLWNITLINSGQSVSAYLFGSMTNNENGELIATGQTMTFEVKKGTTHFKVSDLPKVPDVNYVSKDPKYKTSFMNTGGAPPGDYKICVELRYTNNSVAGEDCIEQKVIGGDAPQLISPRDEEEINNDKVRIEEMIGKEISTFAYPFGQAKDFTEATEKIVQEVGYTHAFTTEGVFVDFKNTFTISRLCVEDGQSIVRLRQWIEGGYDVYHKIKSLCVR